MAILVWRRILLPLLLLLPLLSLAHADANSHPPSPKVIILNSYHPGFVWSDDELSGLLERLRQRYPGIDPAIEYLDTKHFPTEEHLLRVKDYLASKYLGQKFDLAVALDNSALEMILRHHQELFPGVPLVFSGIDNFEPSMLAGQKKVTGVAEVVSIAETLETALALFPQTEEILVVHDYTKTGLASQREVAALLPAFRNRVHIKSSPPAAISEIVDQIQALSAESLVLIIGFAADREGKTFSQAESTRLLTEGIKIPTFATNAGRLGHGIIGGYLLGGKDQGRRAGDIALRVLAGEDPSGIPVDMQSTARPMFDYRQLSRFHISPGSLPAGSIIINRPESFYGLHKALVWGTVSVVTTLSLVVFVLSINIIRRRKAEEAWRQSEERYQNLVHNVPLGLYRSTPGPQGDLFLANPAITRMFGYESVDELLQIHAADVYVEPATRQFLSDELISQGHVTTKELQFKKKDGTCFWGALTANAVRNEAGEIIYFDGFVEDITEKKLAVEALRTAAQQWRTTFDSISDAVCLLDLECTILQCNQAMATMMGKPVEEIIGRRCHEIVHGCSQPIEGCPVVRMQQTRQPEEQLLAFGDRWLTTRADPILDQDGILTGAVHIISDITQQKQSEEALRESEEHYRTLVETSPDAIVFMDLNANIFMVNQQAAVLTGHEYAGEMFNRNAADFLVASDHSEITESLRQIIDAGGVKNLRFTVQQRHGALIPVEVNASLIRGAQGEPENIIAIVRDISERQQMEAILRESEESYRTLAKNLPGLVYRVHLQGNNRMEFFNDMVETMTGFMPTDLCHGEVCGIDRLIHPEDRVQVISTVKRALEHNQPFELDYRLRQKNGTVRYLMERGRPVLGPDGQKLFIDGVILDISERKQLELALSESEEKYRLLVNQIPAVVFLGYADWSIDFFDEKVKTLTGYSKEDFNNRQLKWNELILPEDLPAAKRDFIKGLHSDQSYVREYRIRRKDGEIIWIQNLGQIFCDASGKIDHVSGVLFDITDRKQIESRLSRANRALRAVSECNQALVRATDEAIFLNDVCRIIVDECGYPLAWIGFAQPDAAKRVPPVAFAGVEGANPGWINITWGDDERGQGPGGMAIKTGKTQMIRNILDSPNAIPWHEEARRRGLNSIIALPLIVDGKTIGILDVLARDLEAFDESEAKLLEELAAAVSYGIWSLQTALQRHQAEAEVRHTLEQLHRSLDGTVLALANMAEYRDPYTAGHQQRVAQLACAIAAEMGLSPDQIEGLRVTGYLHDIGKIAVPAEILSKPGKINANEFNIIKVHPQVGNAILKDIEFPWPVAQGILQHHERLDGSGYPHGLADPNIIKEAKILAVADVVEAMASHRPYRPALGIAKALEEISQNRGILYDPEVVDVCIRLFMEEGFHFD